MGLKAERVKRHNMGRELNLLLNAVRLVLNPEAGDDNSWQGDLSECKPGLLIRLANHHGLIPCLATYLNSTELPSNTFEADFLRRVQSLAKVQQFNSERQARIAAELSQRLKQSSVSHIVFKGPALMQQIYPDFIKSRKSDDLDILVAPELLSKALNVLENADYAANSDVDAHKIAQFVTKYPKCYRGRDIGLCNNTELDHYIDLHWNIADDFSFTADTSELLSSKVMLDTHYGALPTLPLHQHFVYLCAHGYSDYFFRLQYLVEVYLATKHTEFDKNQALKLAEDHGVLNQVTQAMELALWLFAPSNKTIKLNHSLNHGSNNDLNNYGESIIRRLIDTKGFTPRIHPNRGVWTRTDKNQHLIRQIKNRSSKSSWFSPIIARTKITPEQLSHWQANNTSLVTFYLKNLCLSLNRLWRSS